MPSKETALALEVADVLREMDDWSPAERAEVIRSVRVVLVQLERPAAAERPRGPVLAGIDEAE